MDEQAMPSRRKDEQRRATQVMTPQQTPETSAHEAASSQKLPGLISAVHFPSKETNKKPSVNQAQADGNDGWDWLHFDSSDPGARRSLESLSGLSAPAKTLLIAASDHQQLSFDEDCTYGVLADLVESLDEGVKDIFFIPFAMTKCLFVTASDRPRTRLQSVHDAFLRGEPIDEPAMLLNKIVEFLLDDISSYADDLAKRLDEIEESILDDGSGDQRQSIARIRQVAVRLHRQIAISQSLTRRIERDKDAQLLRFAEVVTQRLDWLGSKVDALRERAQLLQEEAMAITADQTNSQVQTLSIVATVFLPATLIAGIFGMNVSKLPLTENGNGFLWAMLILVGATALIFWLLRWSGLVGR
jgi:zinc transporter